MINYTSLDELRKAIRDKKDSIASKRNERIKSNPYYYGRLLNSLKYIVPPGAKVLHVGCGTGYILNRLEPGLGVGVESSAEHIEIARKNYPDYQFFDQELENVHVEGIFDYIVICDIEDIVDIKSLLDSIRKNCGRHTRVVVNYYNYLWQPLVGLAEKMHLRIRQKVHNWFAPPDMKNLLVHSGYDLVNTKMLILFPYYIPLISGLLDRFLARLPFFRIFTMSRLAVARMNVPEHKDLRVTIVIPCRNEVGNIQNAVERIPQLGAHTEIIFCDDKSTDGTADNVREMMRQYPEKDIKLVDGPGICKADNVWTGFDKASGDVMLILDADLTMPPEEMPKFYEAIASGRAEFANGSRLVYPMEKAAMRFLNMCANKTFGILFTWILGQPLKDTLCGTKVLRRADYDRIVANRAYFGNFDPFGDFDLLFGAARLNMKIVDVPIRYRDRTYGSTNIHRWRHGWLLLRMVLFAARKLKFV